MTSNSAPQTFGPLWKGLFGGNLGGQKNPPLNWRPLPQTAPIVGTPNRASADLLRQAREGILKGKNRKGQRNALLNATARKPAAVVGPPAVKPVPPGAATPTAPAAPVGFGGSGYSGRVASLLGHASNPGTTTPTVPLPKPGA